MWQRMPGAIRESRTLEQLNAEWWHDARPNGGWRLSWSGYVDLVNVLEVEFWDFDFTNRDIAAWMYLRLKQHIVTPYYIVQNRKHTKLTVFDSKQAMMINLYGEVGRWIASLRA